MENGMIERVARALSEVGAAVDWEHATASAHAAIEAMREPTEVMIADAAETPGMTAASSAMQIHQARGFRFDPSDFADGSPLHQAWRAMIDAALADPQRLTEAA